MQKWFAYVDIDDVRRVARIDSVEGVGALPDNMGIEIIFRDERRDQTKTYDLEGFCEVVLQKPELLNFLAD